MAEITQLLITIITVLGAFFALYVLINKFKDKLDSLESRVTINESHSNIVEEKLTTIESTLDKVILRLDLFLKTEREEFREIVRQNTQALKDLAK